MRTLSITAKCSDMFRSRLIEEKGPYLEYDGYVPSWFPNPNVQHFGDYVELKIDIETGRILNWKKPTEEQLKKTFEERA